MQPLAIAHFVLCCLVSLVWLSRHALLWRERRSSPALSPDSPGLEGPRPPLTVVVAAKDEQDNIEQCLRTMLDQDYGDFELIVANDRSNDRTGEIVEGIARHDERVRLINIAQLPEGWCGKNNAMQTAIAASRGQWLCMIDADCRQLSRRTLTVAMRHADDTGADMLSVLPVLEMRGFWENVIQPVCGGVMMIWFRPDRVNDPRRKAAYANGAFMLMRRQTYDAVGGHAAVRDKHNEDMHLAALVKHSGRSLRVVRSEGLYLTRMYTSVAAMLRGWSRIFFGTFGTLGRLSASLLILLIVSLMPWAVAVGSLAACACGAGFWWRAAAIAGAAAVAIQLSVLVRFYRIVHAKPHLAWTYPLGCVIAAAALVQALGKLRPGAKLVWRGTAYTRTG